MKTDYIEMHKSLEERLTQLGNEIPGPMTGFARLHKKSVEEGALSSKVKEMMALAISIVVGCEGCIAYHVHDAVAAGATRQEILETIGVGIMMGGGPGSISHMERMRWMPLNSFYQIDKKNKPIF